VLKVLGAIVGSLSTHLVSCRFYEIVQ